MQPTGLYWLRSPVRIALLSCCHPLLVFPPLALALAIFTFAILFLELFQAREVFDFLFPRRRGENVVGTVRPRGEPSQRVIVSAHMDSAYEWILYLFKSASILLTVIAIVALVIVFGACLAKTLAYFNVFSNDAALNGVGIALIALSPVVFLLLFFTLWKPVPGAGDDMAVVSVVAGLGMYLGEAKSSRAWLPERTEVVLLATSSEEDGVRGAKRYVKRHLKEMKDMRTYFLTVDGFSGDNTITVSKGELATGARHDPGLVKMAQEVAASHNWPIAATQEPPMGFSDASPFSWSGIPATWLSAYNHAGSRSGFPKFHTRHDTYEHIRPESLSVMLQLVIDMIQRIDKS